MKKKRKTKRYRNPVEEELGTRGEECEPGVESFLAGGYNTVIIE